MANEYLKRKPVPSPGNTKTWTWASWFKLNETSPTVSWAWLFNTSVNGGILINYGGSPYESVVYFYDHAGSIAAGAAPSFRDLNAWYHLTVNYDSTEKEEKERIRFYMNGKRLEFSDTITPTWPVLNYESSWSSSVHSTINGVHSIGRWESGATRHIKAQYFDQFWVDGQAIIPEVFGFYKEGDGYMSSGNTNGTDFKSGQWSPRLPKSIKHEINRSGGFGTSGFYLPMNDSSNPGADFHCTPNTIIKLKGEDLPQPRNGAPITSDSFVSQLREEPGTLGFDGCIKCDGNDGIDVADNAALDLGTGDFTIEGFYYLTDFTPVSYHSLFDMRGDGGDGLYMSLFRHNSEDKLYLYANSAVRIDNIPRKNNEWMHVAICRSSGVTRAFVDGELAGSFSDTHDYICRNLLIGQSTGNSNDLYGFISNFRIVKGTALYTSNFTRPTSPLENVANTILLCANSSTDATASTVTPSTITAIGDVFATKNELTGSIVLAAPFIGGGQGDYSADIRGSGTNKTVNVLGDAVVAECPSHYGSALKSTTGAGNYTEVAADAEFANLYDVDHTIEFWYKNNVWDDSYLPHDSIIGLKSGTNCAWRFAFTDKNTNEDGIQLFGTNGFSTGAHTLNNDWNHCAVEQYTISDGTIKTTVYINGIAAGQNTGPVGYVAEKASTGPIIIGTDPRSSTLGDTYSFRGEIQDVRIYKGVAKYKGSFDVPQPYTPIGIESWRITPDNSENNFCTWNFNKNGNSQPHQLSNGNLTMNQSNSYWRSLFGTHGMSSGKFYYEMKTINDKNYAYIGVANDKSNVENYPSSDDHSWALLTSNGKAYHDQNGTQSLVDFNTALSTGITNNDIIGVAFDADNGRIWWSVSGTWLQGDPATGASPVFDSEIPTGVTYFPVAGCYQESAHVNFGQNQTLYGSAAVDRNRLNSTNSSYTLEFGGSSGNFTVSNDGKTLSGTTASSSYMRATMTLDPTKKYLVSATHTAGSNNNFAIQDDKGYLTTTDGTATSALQVGVRYTVEISASTSARITATAWNTTYEINDIVISEIDEGYPDSNGKGKFAYDPPTGFLALCDDNLPTPIADPGKNFKTVLYDGDGAFSKSINGVGFKPDLVWIKCRSDAKWGPFVDSVRGNSTTFYTNSSNATNAEIHIPNFSSDGFTVSDIDSGTANEDGMTYVAWCWKAGGKAVVNRIGSVTSLVSVNQEAGFSVVKFTSQTTNNAITVGHGLGKKPAFWLWKDINGATGWYQYHQDMGSSAWLKFNNDAATTSNAAAWGGTDPTDTVFTQGSGFINQGDVMMYLWAEIEGYSKFGSYAGNTSTNGAFVNCGFKPAFVMIKSNTLANSSWIMVDSSRDPVNPCTRKLFPSSSGEENVSDPTGATAATNHIDLLSNGFKCRTDNSWTNYSGETYIFAAFAESPFQTANAK